MAHAALADEKRLLCCSTGARWPLIHADTPLSAAHKLLTELDSIGTGFNSILTVVQGIIQG